MERITVLIGAGAILDFDFNCEGIVPSTRNITNEMDEIRVQGVDGQEKEVIKAIHDWLEKAHYEEQNPARCPEYREKINPINFETLYHVTENLYSFSSVWKDEWIMPQIFPPVAAFVDCKQPFAEYQTEEYHRSLVAMENRICEIVGEYDTRFVEDKEYALWYRGFWQQFSNNLDVFTLNYDTTIEQSLEDYEDGFVSMTGDDKQRFEPAKLLYNKERSSVNHLHGCITYLNQWNEAKEHGYGFNDMFKFATYKQRIEKKKGYSGTEYNQSHEAYIQRSIVVGMRKPDKIVSSPMNFYHANLVNKICENPSLLIVGYSFGDAYVNEYLYKMRLIHGSKRRIVLIDKWLGRQCGNAMKLFINTETGDDRAFWDELRSGEYYAPHVSRNGTLMVLICGFKYAVEHHADEIREFMK